MNSLIDGYTVTLRPATLSDALILYKWATDPVVRQNSISQDIFPFDHHVNWFRDKLNSEKTKFFISETFCPVGYLRLDKNDDSSWTISFAVDTVFRGMGIGKKIVEEGIKSMGKVNYRAWVKDTNAASLKVFRGLGFIEKRNAGEQPDLLLFELNNHA